MALSQSIDTPFGVPATYWTITRFTIDRVNLSVEIQLNGYATQDAELNRQQPIAQKTFNVNFVENPPAPQEKVEGMSMFFTQMIPTQAITPELIGLFQTISQFGYGLVKVADEFSTAENV